MKSTHEPFDEELKGRLLQYTEEPDKDLWQGIVPRIVSVNPEPRWAVWTTRLSVLVIALSGAYFVFTGEEATTAEDRISQNEMLMPGPFNSPAIDTLEARAASGTRDRSGSNNVIQDERAISLQNSANPEIPHAQLRVLSSGIPGEKENVSVPVKSDPSLSGHESTAVGARPTPSEAATRQSPHQETALIKDPIEPEQPGPSKETHKRKKPFSLYFTAMPTFGYQRIESNKKDGIDIHGIKPIPAFSAERLGVRLEAGVEIPLSKGWKAFGGILYYQRKQTIGYTERQRDSVIVGSGPDGNGTLEPQYKYVSKSIEYELKNVGLQVGLSYQLWRRTQKSTMSRVPSSQKIPVKTKNKFLHEVGTGIEFHKSLREPRELESAEGFSDPSTYVFFNMYYRLQYPNAGRLRAILQPTLNYSFYINENLNAPFYVKPYGLGLNFGCKYHFW